MIDDDTETEEALAEFDFLVEEAENGAGEAQSHGDGPEWGKSPCLLVLSLL
jgi:striatin 1/3/4